MSGPQDVASLPHVETATRRQAGEFVRNLTAYCAMAWTDRLTCER